MSADMSARELFAARGLDVPMAAIARHAGVGVATLYRRFPTRESLITEVFADQLAACLAAVYDGLADPDPWRGFCAAIRTLCDLQALDRGFTAAFTAAFPGAVDLDAQRDRAMGAFAELAQRAKDAGQLRADFAPDDLLLLLKACGGLTAGPAETALAASRRLTAYLLHAFRADPGRPPEPLPPRAPPFAMTPLTR
jgi:AcrR family transcriptional regulator